MDWVEESNEQLSIPMKMKRKIGSKWREFIGWGSKPLIEFLESIGKDTSKQLSQHEVTNIINGYINVNSLVHPEKKKRILCDERLHSLFGRKSVARNKIFDLLDAHFAENHDESEDELMYGSEEENLVLGTKKQKISSSDAKTSRQKEKVVEIPKSCFAAINSENVKLVYLKRSLVQDLLKDRESFEVKVVDSYVRVKSDPHDYFQKNSHQLLLVTGVKSTSKAGDVGAEIILQVSNFIKDIRICMLSDDTFSEEECEDLRQRVKTGVLKRPTVAELQQKAKILHEDITKHWLVKEIALLQNLIDRANEKGWRRELFEYLERKRLLQTPSEQSRLLQEVPKVIADELELEATPKDPLGDADADPCGTDAAGSTAAVIPSQIIFSELSVGKEGNGYFNNGVAPIKEPEIRVAFEVSRQDKKLGSTVSVIPSQFIFSDSSVGKEGNGYFNNGVTPIKEPEIRAAFEASRQDKKIDFVQQHKRSSTPIKNESSGGTQVVNSGENNGSQRLAEKKILASPVIELSDDDDDNDNEEAESRGGQNQIVESHPESTIWYYTDPQLRIQGPFSLTALKRWSDADYFSPGFKVWKTGKSQNEAVLLIDLLRLTFPH